MPELEEKQVEQQPPVVEDKPDESKQPEVEEKKPDFDPTQFQEKLETSLSEKIAQNLTSFKEEFGKALGLSKEEKKEIPSDPAELEKFIQSQVDSRLKSYQESEQQKQAATEKQRDDQIKGIISNWDTEYESLVRQGKAPEIKKRNDMSDPGWRARQALIKTVGDISKKEREEGLSNRVPSLYEAFTYNPRAVRGVAGADLPISGNTPNNTATEFDYQKDVRGSSIQSILEQVG